MLNEPKRFILQTTANERVEVDVNYSDNPLIAGSNVLRFTKGKQVLALKRDDLVSLLMAVGTSDDMKKLIPVTKTDIKKMERLLEISFDAKKDYKKGEKVYTVLRWIDEVPTEEETFAGALKRGPKFFGGSKILSRLAKKT
jgi:hypothetical protein